MVSTAATMAGDYTRCLWPVTTHGVYVRYAPLTTRGVYGR